MKGVFVLMACLLAVFLPQQDCDAACIGDGGGKKVLVAYFSVSGNTRAVAEHIASVTDGDVWHRARTALQPERRARRWLSG